MTDVSWQQEISAYFWFYFHQLEFQTRRSDLVSPLPSPSLSNFISKQVLKSSFCVKTTQDNEMTCIVLWTHRHWCAIEPLSDFWAESYIRLGKRSFLYFGNKVIISCYVVTIFFVFWLMVGFLASQSYANVWGDGWPGLGCDQHRHKLETENITQFRENISFEYSQPAKSSPHATTTTTPDCQGGKNK